MHIRPPFCTHRRRRASRPCLVAWTALPALGHPLVVGYAWLSSVLFFLESFVLPVELLCTVSRRLVSSPLVTCVLEEG